MDADWDAITREGHLLHDDIADCDVIWIGEAQRYGVNGDAACA
jgi:hypothetical protein